MSIVSQPLSDKKKTKELKVLKLYQEGYSSRKIASLVHLSLRDVTKYIHRISNKTKSPSSTSVMDEVVLEYRVAGLKCEVRDLKIERDNLMNEVKDLRAQKKEVQNQLSVKRSELDVVNRNLEYARFSKVILNDIFTDGQITT
jgi:DNA-binding CsgD family transcriptional regulator